MAGSSSDAFYRETNSSAAYNNPKFIAIIVNQIEQRMGRILSSGEINKTSNFIRKLDNDMLLRMPTAKVIQNITKALVTRFADYRCVEEPLQARELLKSQIGISAETDVVQSVMDMQPAKSVKEIIRESQMESAGGANMIDVAKILGYTKTNQIQKVLNPNALLRTNYILLDTRYRLLDNDGTRYFQWTHINNISRAQGSVNTVGTIRDIVAMRVYPFRIPYTAALDTPYKKVSMLMREFQAQSFVAQEGRRFHFMFDIIIDGDSIYLRPEDNNDAYYRFYQPVTQIDMISIDFGSPLEDVVFDSDRSLGFTNLYWDGIQTQITTQTPHNLLTGNNVYITGFTSLNPIATPVVVASMNSSVGHNVIVVSPTVFKISVNSSPMTPLIQGGVGVTLNVDQVTGITVPLVLDSGDRVRITSSAAPPFAFDYGVYIVKFYDAVAGVIHLDQDSGQVLLTPCYVFRDYRMPPLTRNDGLATVNPVGGITVIDNTVSAVGSRFLSDYKDGDSLFLFNIAAAVDEGPYSVVSILNDTQMTITRVLLGQINNLTALKTTLIQDNLYQVYYGGKRIFVPLELTYISPEV